MKKAQEKIIGTNLKRIRKDNRLSVSDVQKLLLKKGINVADKTIYGWESGDRILGADKLIALSQIYNIKEFEELTREEMQEIEEIDANDYERSALGLMKYAVDKGLTHSEAMNIADDMEDFEDDKEWDSTILHIDTIAEYRTE